MVARAAWHQPVHGGGAVDATNMQAGGGDRPLPTSAGSSGPAGHATSASIVAPHCAMSPSCTKSTSMQCMCAAAKLCRNPMWSDVAEKPAGPRKFLTR